MDEVTWMRLISQWLLCGGCESGWLRWCGWYEWNFGQRFVRGITMHVGSSLSRKAWVESRGEQISFLDSCPRFCSRRLVRKVAAFTWRYCRCSSWTTILFHLSIFNLIDFRVNSWRNSTLRSLFSSTFALSLILEPLQTVLRFAFWRFLDTELDWGSPWHWRP